MNSNTKLSSGILWSIIEVVLKRVFDLIIKLFLAKLLFPSDFGIIGMATVFISFVQVINEGGMGAVLIQKKDENITESHFNTVFWSNLIWSFFLYLIILFIIAPIASWFYEEPILKTIIPVLSISLFTSSLNVVHKSQLMRTLKFKKLAFINNISTLVAGVVALILAYLDFGIWSLIANSIIAYMVSVPLFYFQTRWKPKLEINFTILKEVLSFGIYTTLTMLIINLVNNSDYLLIGKFVGSAALGAYTLAYMMTSMVKGQVTSMLNRVMYPFYSKIQDDIELLKSYYLRLIKYYSIILYPIMIFIILYGDLLITFVYGNKWNLTILPMKFLAAAMLIDVLTNGYNLLFRSTGRPKLEMKLQILTSLLIYVPSISIGLYFYGYIGVAIGVLFSKIISFLILQYVLRIYFSITFKDLINSLSRVIFGNIFVGLLCYILSVFVFDYITSMFIFLLLVPMLYIFLLKDEVKFLKKKFTNKKKKVNIN